MTYNPGCTCDACDKNKEIASLKDRIAILERQVNAYADASFSARKLLDEVFAKLYGFTDGRQAINQCGRNLGWGDRGAGRRCNRESGHSGYPGDCDRNG